MYNFNSENEKLTPYLVSSINFTLQKGEGLLIHGENGVGKTSLIKKMIENYSLHYNLSYSFQESLDCFYDRTLEDVSDIFSNLFKTSIDLEKFNFLFSQFQLEKKKKRFISELSGGEMQALKLSLFLSKEADVYFLDEPLKALDIQKKQILLKQLDELRFLQKSVVVIEHLLISFDSSWRKMKLIQEGSFLKAQEV